MKAKQSEPVAKDIHSWFSLSYANYLVLHRAMLQSMPDDWQDKFVNLLDEMEKYYGYPDIPRTFHVKVRARGNDGKFMKDPVPHYRHAPKLTARDFTSWFKEANEN